MYGNERVGKWKRGTMGKSSCYYTMCVELSAAGSVGIKFMFIMFILYSWCSIVVSFDALIVRDNSLCMEMNLSKNGKGNNGEIIVLLHGVC